MVSEKTVLVNLYRTGFPIKTYYRPRAIVLAVRSVDPTTLSDAICSWREIRLQQTTEVIYNSNCLVS